MGQTEQFTLERGRQIPLPAFRVQRQDKVWQWGLATKDWATSSTVGHAPNGAFKSFHAVEVELYDGYKGALDVGQFKIADKAFGKDGPR